MLEFKYNINKIDSDLKDFFENVSISEKAEKGSFWVSIAANKMFLFEGCKKRVEVKVDINKVDLNFNTIKWSYSVNPLNENSEKIERISSIETIAKDIYEVASNKRMVNEYFNNLEAHVELINEECTPSFGVGGLHPMHPANTKIINISEFVRKYTSYNSYLPTDTCVEYSLSEEISMSNKFRLEKDLLDSGLINYVSFNNSSIKVTF